MPSTGIRDLKNNLSRYLRRLKAGDVLTVTDRGRVVAELRPLEAVAGAAAPRATHYAQLVAAGVIRPAVETGDPLADWPTTRAVALPRGTAAALLAEIRGA
ncbi:MAG: type II toxin-antitoxin system Phd/YefM family antitoxin [Gemmatimonadaceae bacterium]